MKIQAAAEVKVLAGRLGEIADTQALIVMNTGTLRC
ncbi:MAG: hypothetical protein ACI9R3_004482 [Verrucomicrobiales bacterium]|jgi:hypothetical protein